MLEVPFAAVFSLFLDEYLNLSAALEHRAGSAMRQALSQYSYVASVKRAEVVENAGDELTWEDQKHGPMLRLRRTSATLKSATFGAQLLPLDMFSAVVLRAQPAWNPERILRLYKVWTFSTEGCNY
jgi:hypothetical protein